MRLADLPVPAALIERHAAHGITELYPPQAACVEQGLLDGRNLLVAIPTASGKTLVAELAMHRAIAAGGKCLYIVPLRALAAEKYAEFSSSARVGIATGDFDRRDDYLGRNEIVVATSEKVDSLLRNRTPWLAEVTLLVVDEVHLVGSPDRGATLEPGDREAPPAQSVAPADRALGHDREPGNARGMARRGPRRLGLAAGHGSGRGSTTAGRSGSTTAAASSTRRPRSPTT